jgi:formylglycine-generating enzyme required for sulfatase activity
MKKPASDSHPASRRAPQCVICISLAGLILAGCGTRSGKPQGQPSPIKSAGGIEMMVLPGGWFNMGSASQDEPDQKLHKVYVSTFAMDKYPVTQESYQKLMGTNGSHWKAPRNPVEQIRWRDAARYCNARSQAEGLQPAYDTNTWACHFEASGYRLPTEAEYEYALRAGSDTTFFFGNTADDLKRYAWFKGNSPRGPHPVGEKPPNPWGLCDLVGNVWEWCNDIYQEDFYAHSPEQDPRGPPTGENRVVRGGCWNSKPEHCRSAYRYYEMPAYTDICFAKDLQGQIGFRCVRNAGAH